LGWFSGVWICFSAKGSEHSVSSTYIDGVSRKRKRIFHLHRQCK
jgi:hypothetical protein